MTSQDPIVDTEPTTVFETITGNESERKWALAVTPGVTEVRLAEMEATPFGFQIRRWDGSAKKLLDALNAAEESPLYIGCVTVTFERVLIEPIDMYLSGIPGVTMHGATEEYDYTFHIHRDVAEKMLCGLRSYLSILTPSQASQGDQQNA